MTLSAAKAASKIRSALESGQLCFTYRTSSLLAGTRHPTIDVVNANEMTLFAYLAASHILVLVAYGTPSFRHYLLPREANLDVAYFKWSHQILGLVGRKEKAPLRATTL